MLSVTSLGESVLSARLTEKDALEVVHDTLTYPDFEQDQLIEGATPSEKIHRYQDPATGKWVTSGYKVTSVQNPMTHHAHALLQKALEDLAPTGDMVGDLPKQVISYEWGVRIEDASGVERILDPASLEIAAKNRLERYRQTWPTARLVRRPVYDEPWEEVSADGE